MDVVPVALEHGLAGLPRLVDVPEGGDQTGGAGAEALAGQAAGAAEERRGQWWRRRTWAGNSTRKGRESTINKHSIEDGQEGIINITT